MSMTDATAGFYSVHDDGCLTKDLLRSGEAAVSL